MSALHDQRTAARGALRRQIPVDYGFQRTAGFFRGLCVPVTCTGTPGQPALVAQIILSVLLSPGRFAARRAPLCVKVQM